MDRRAWQGHKQSGVTEQECMHAQRIVIPKEEPGRLQSTGSLRVGHN